MAKGRNILAVATLLALSTTALLGNMGVISGSHRLRAPLHDAMPWGPPDGVSSLDYHGGPTLTTSTSYAIFWAPRGSSFEASGSSAYQSLLTRYLSDVGGSPLYRVVTQYYRETSNARQDIRNASSLGGVYIDSSPYPEAATTAHPLRDREIQGEILRVMRVTGWTPTAGHVFFVYTTDRAQSCIGNGAGSVPSTPIARTTHPSGRRTATLSSMPLSPMRRATPRIVWLETVARYCHQI